MEVRYTGTVTTAPIFFSSKRSHRTHEQFDVRAASLDVRTRSLSGGNMQK